MARLLRMAATVAAELRRADRRPRHLRPRTAALGRQPVPALAVARQMGAAADRFRRLRRRLREKTPLHAPGAPRAGRGCRANRASLAPRRYRAPRCGALARPPGPARRARARPAPCGIPRSAEPLLSHLSPGPAGQSDAAIPERSRRAADGEGPRAAAQGIARRRLALGAVPVAARNGELTITCLMGSNSLWRVEEAVL